MNSKLTTFIHKLTKEVKKKQNKKKQKLRTTQKHNDNYK